MNSFFEIVLPFLQRNWAKPWSASATAVVAFIGVLWVAWPSNGVKGLAGLPLGGAVIAAALALGLWYFTNRVPRSPKGNVGFLVALTCENDKHEKKVRADFIDQLRKHLVVDEQVTKFKLIVYPSTLAEQITTHSDALRFLAKSRGHFMIWGRVRERVSQTGQKVQYLSLNGLVNHTSANAPARKELQEDFSSVIPRFVEIPEAGSVYHFEATSEWLDASARYVVGLAALMSGDLAYAEKMFLAVESRIAGSAGRYAALQRVKQKLPGLFITLYGVWLDHLASQFVRTRDTEFLRRAVELADKLLARDAAHYRAMLAKAMGEFTLSRNTAGAKKILRKCKVKEPTWRYSLAFILAYEGDLIGADAEYRRAFKIGSEDITVPVQVEEFIQATLESEPNKTQLHYCAALINYYAKRDHQAAEKDLRLFLSAALSQQYPKQRREAERLLQSLEPTHLAGPLVEVDARLQPMRR